MSRAFIEAWMSDFIPSSAVSAPGRSTRRKRALEDPPPPPPARRRRPLAPIDPSSVDNEARGRTQGRRKSPRKKDLHCDDVVVDTPAAPQAKGTHGAARGAKTTRGRGRGRPATQTLPLRPPGPDSESIGRSMSTFDSCARQRSRSRTSSPVKTLMDLQFSDIGISYNKFSDVSSVEDALGEVTGLPVRDMELFASLEAIVHPDLRAQVAERTKRSQRWLDMACARADEDDQAMCIQPSELDEALEIIEQSAACDEEQDCEAAWNCEVHSRILRLAVKPFKEIIGQKNISTARIVPECCPHMPDRRLEAKMVDFALHLRHHDPDIEPTLLPTLTAEHPNFPERRTINHTVSPPLRGNPIAVSIETKPAGSGNSEATAQLALWASAHLNRLEQLVSHCSRMAGVEPAGPLPTLPLVGVVGSRWSLYFLRRNDDGRDALYGEHEMGGSNSLVGMLRLVASLRRLAKWVEFSFRPWFLENCLMPVE